MFMACELSRSMAYMTAVVLADPEAGDGELRKAVSAAKVQIGRAGRFVGGNAIQLHGGMGMTDEMPISHYFKRLVLIDSQFGDADHSHPGDGRNRSLNGPAGRYRPQLVPGPEVAGRRPGGRYLLPRVVQSAPEGTRLESATPWKKAGRQDWRSSVRHGAPGRPAPPSHAGLHVLRRRVKPGHRHGCRLAQRQKGQTWYQASQR